jgi:DNA-binding MurR/RpiR family transcriptional regulator
MKAQSSPLDRLRRALPVLAPKMQEVGRFVVGNDFDAATRSMRDLAATAGVTPSTFTRLARALGYAGWDELRDALVEARRPEVQPHFSARVRRGGEAVEQLPAEMIAADAARLRVLDADAITTAARLLHAAPRLWIAGFRSCYGVAQLMHYELRLFRPDGVRLVGSSGPEDLDLGSLAEHDTVVLIGFAPYSRASILTGRAARAASCTLIAIADTPVAPMAEGASHVLLFDAATGPGFFPSLTGALVTAQALTASVFALGGEEALRQLRTSEARLSSLAQYAIEGPSGARKQSRRQPRALRL